MAYLDTAPLACSVLELAGSRAWCNCTSTWMARPGQCLAGDVDYARERWTHAVHNSEYRAFLEYMCPPAAAHGTGQGASPGQGTSPAGHSPFPPVGTDPASCPRPILGVYDDHDYGWNNGDRRLPHKGDYKQMFLDATGEAPDSPRRSSVAGLQGSLTLNGGGPGRDIDVVLLDERWYRDVLPCEMRRDWCQRVVLPSSNASAPHPLLAWCINYLLDDGATGRGACCAKDEQLATWCKLPSSRTSPLWASACDPTSPSWADQPLALGPDNATLLALGDQLWDTAVNTLWSRMWQAHDSPACEVLGLAQRSWLRGHVSASSAPLTLLASGSVVLGGVGYTDPEQGYCSSDDWNCYQPAQLNLLHTLANASGCVVILTGDFHFADIKVLMPGTGHNYTERFQTDKMKKPIYQIMSSGMTASTAKHDGKGCGTYIEDVVGLRPLGRCSFAPDPNFGMVEVDWEARVVHLTVRRASNGQVALGYDNSLQHVAFNLDTCLPLPAEGGQQGGTRKQQ